MLLCFKSSPTFRIFDEEQSGQFMITQNDFRSVIDLYRYIGSCRIKHITTHKVCGTQGSTLKIFFPQLEYNALFGFLTLVLLKIPLFWDVMLSLC